MPFLEVEPNTELYYEAFGDSGRPIIFTSSGNASHAMWQGQAAHFAPAHRTVTYDWRGTGSSGKPSSGYTGAQAAADLVALTRAVTTEPAVLVGHGMGAHVSLLATLEAPELVAGLVLADGGPWYTGTHDGIAGGMSEEFLSVYDDASRSYPDILAEVVHEWMFAEPPSQALAHATLMDGLTWPQHIADEYGRTMWDLDFRASLQQVHTPALVVHGCHDRKQRYEGAVYLADKLPNASSVTLEHSAHCGHVEEASVFNQVLTDFMSTLPRG